MILINAKQKPTPKAIEDRYGLLVILINAKQIRKRTFTIKRYGLLVILINAKLFFEGNAMSRDTDSW